MALAPCVVWALVIIKKKLRISSSFILVPSILITTGTTVTFMFRNFLSSLTMSRYICYCLIPPNPVFWLALSELFESQYLKGFCVPLFKKIHYSVELQSLAQIPADHIPRPVMSTLLVFLGSKYNLLITWLIVSYFMNLHLVSACMLPLEIDWRKKISSNKQDLSHYPCRP